MLGRMMLAVCFAVLMLAVGCAKEENSAKTPPRQYKEVREDESVVQELKKAPEQAAPEKQADEEKGSETTTEKLGQEEADEPEESEAREEPDGKDEEMNKRDLPPGLYAIFETTEGDIVVELYEDKAPETVGNFVGLATGEKEYINPKTGQAMKSKFYDGLTFHRVIPNFMIQGGDPLGTGTGGPGYRFKDEFDKSLRFDGPGYLAMANAGPGTNGSQFFITVAPTPHLNDKHTIFGKVIEGQDVADAISKVPAGRGDKPLEPVVIKQLLIERVK